MIGGGSLEPEIRAEIAGRNLDRIQLLGSLDHNEVRSLLSNFGSIVITSKWEAFGIVALEAMAEGVPVVAVRAGGLEEVIVHEESGYLVESRSPEEIADAVRLLNNNIQLRNKIIEGGKNRVVSLFDVKRMIREIVTVYNSVMSH